MIVYNSQLDQSFSKYGINIPIVDDRASRCFAKLKASETDLSEFKEICDQDLLLAHTNEFVSALKTSHGAHGEVVKAFELDTPGRYTPGAEHEPIIKLVDTMKMQLGATYYSFERALKKGFSYFLGGGMHHAMSFGGRGFCLFNDIVVGIRMLQRDNLIQSAWVIDVDAHMGDGTAQLAAGDDNIVTASMHMQKGWPLDCPDFIKIQNVYGEIKSDIDIELPPSTSDEDYLKQLDFLLKILDSDYKRPDLCIVVNGSDPYEKDVLPSASTLKISEQALLKRDLLLHQFFNDRKIPQSYLMAGGYGPDSWKIYHNFLSELGY